MADALTIVVVYPELMGTYGDGGNAVALRARCTRRGIDAEVLPVHAPDPVPRAADVYLIGGAENASQTTAAELLIAEGGLRAAAERGATVLGICGGYQVLGEWVQDADGATTGGLGLLDVRSSPLSARAVGDLGVRVEGLPELAGFENHAYGTALGADAAPLGAVVAGGVGNGLEHVGGPDPVDSDFVETVAYEGAVQGRVVGTYLHGPLLALNPDFADHLLRPIVGELAPLDDPIAAEARDVRRVSITRRASGSRRP